MSAILKSPKNSVSLCRTYFTLFCCLVSKHPEMPSCFPYKQNVDIFMYWISEGHVTQQWTVLSLKTACGDFRFRASFWKYFIVHDTHHSTLHIQNDLI